MKCPYCEAENPDNSIYCEHCGEKLTSSDSVQRRKGVSNEKTYQRNCRSKERKEEDVVFRMRENSRKRDKNQKLFTLFLCGIVLLIIEIGFAFFRTGSHNSTGPGVLEDTMEEYNTVNYPARIFGFRRSMKAPR